MKQLLTHFLVLSLVSCANQTRQESFEYGDKTLELIEIVNSNPEIKTLLLESIEQAKKINPDKNSNPAQSLEEYYRFVTKCETAMPWRLIDVEYANTLYDRIDQSLSCFFFVSDQPLKSLEGQGLFNNSLQYVEPYKGWLNSFNVSWGQYMDSRESWNDEYYEIALKDEIFGLQNDWYEDPSNWNTFNEFFSRYLKSPDVRPIAEPDNLALVVSPADAAPMGVWAIDSSSMIVEHEGIPIKSATLYDVAKLIGEDSQYAHAFAGGTFTHSFLDVGDYHRYHFPVAGTIKEVRKVAGVSVGGGYVTWDTQNKRYKFDASPVGWQTLETRGCVIVDTGEYGLVALLPIGMWPVSSVNFEDTVIAGAEVRKGDMLGAFLFGGSDFIILFQKNVSFELEAPAKEDGKSYEHLLMGQRLGSLQLR